MTKCKLCESEGITITKHAHRGNQYHYKLRCHTCRRAYFVPRTKEVYEIVKLKQWNPSRSLQRLRDVKEVAGQYWRVMDKDKLKRIDVEKDDIQKLESSLKRKRRNSSLVEMRDSFGNTYCVSRSKPSVW
jgi:hypothetical protein